MLSGKEIFQEYISKIVNHLTAVDRANLTYMSFCYYFIDFFFLCVCEWILLDLCTSSGFPKTVKLQKQAAGEMKVS